MDTLTPKTLYGEMFDTNELVINMGPQHPSTHGVLRVVLRLDGEKVIDAEVVIGYLHRGIEKLSENRNWTQIILLTDRMDYVAAATNNVGYCETVEKLMQLEVPRRARYVRTILCELQRIASHCLWVGTHAMDIGAMTVFLYAFRARDNGSQSAAVRSRSSARSGRGAALPAGAASRPSRSSRRCSSRPPRNPFDPSAGRSASSCGFRSASRCPGAGSR